MALGSCRRPIAAPGFSFENLRCCGGGTRFHIAKSYLAALPIELLVILYLIDAFNVGLDDLFGLDQLLSELGFCNSATVLFFASNHDLYASKPFGVLGQSLDIR